MDESFKESLRNSIIEVLKLDNRPITANLLMHKVFKIFQDSYPTTYITSKDFSIVLDELIKKHWVGRNKNNKYYLDYLDYEELDAGGEGYLEVDPMSGHGYIVIKRNYREYKNPSYFVHKKNIMGAKWGDYVEFRELDVKSKNHRMKDAVVKRILPKPKLSM